MTKEEKGRMLDEQASEYLVNGEYQKAMDTFLLASREGYYISMYNIACMYYFGDGVEKDEGKALEWYKKAAEYGDAEGANRAGIMLQAGLGTETDEAEAFSWFERAAAGGSLGGMANLGLCFLNGKGTETDGDKGLCWLRKASEGGNGIASVMLGDFCRDGSDPAEQDLDAAKKYYERGVQQKYKPAVLALADLYERGLGVPADSGEAARLRELAETIEEDAD